MDTLFGVDAATERGQQLDAQIDAFNRQKVADGEWSWADYQGYEERSAGSRASTYSQQVDESFWEGWGEGFDSMTGAVRNTLNFPGRFLWASIPWWIWVGGLVALAWYLGLFTWLKGSLSKE